MTEYHPENGEQCDVGPSISIQYYGPATFAHYLTLNLYEHGNESNTLRPSETSGADRQLIVDFYRAIQRGEGGQHSASYGIVFSEQPWLHIASEDDFSHNWMEVNTIQL